MSVMFSGTGKFLIASTCSGKGVIPFLVTLTPCPVNYILPKVELLWVETDTIITYKLQIFGYLVESVFQALGIQESVIHYPLDVLTSFNFLRSTVRLGSPLCFLVMTIM